MTQNIQDRNSQESIRQFVEDNIGIHKQFALGTISKDGRPWVVCLNLTYDENFNIIWKSEKSSEHSKHILHNPAVAICIFSETEHVGDFGFYANAIAREITDINELEKAIKLRFTDRGKLAPPSTDFLGDNLQRLYIAELQSVWINDDIHDKRELKV